jgi:hypothetical protein
MTTTLQAKNLTMGQLQDRFHLERVKDAAFFPEWQVDLPELRDDEKHRLVEVAEEYEYLSRRDGMAESLAKMGVVSPLLKLAGFYRLPFQVTAEYRVEVLTEDEGTLVRGSIDLLVIQERLWVVSIEAKRSQYSLEVAYPQVLFSMLSQSSTQPPVFGLVTNGNEFRLLKWVKESTPRYGLSDVFVIDRSDDLYQVARVLKHLGQLAQP